jgi:hypothetical protein
MANKEGKRICSERRTRVEAGGVGLDGVLC